MEARRFRGVLSEGDWVEVPDGWEPGETLHLRQVRNLTTGSNFTGRRYALGYTAKLLVFILVSVVIVLSVINWWSLISKILWRPSPRPRPININLKH
jgi:hypothetical protein